MDVLTFPPPLSPLQVSAPAGLFPITQDASRTWVSPTFVNKGLGNRACPFVPPELLVRSRCGEYGSVAECEVRGAVGQAVAWPYYLPHSDRVKH